jgi:hypothetical protein
MRFQRVVVRTPSVVYFYWVFNGRRYGASLRNVSSIELHRLAWTLTLKEGSWEFMRAVMHEINCRFVDDKHETRVDNEYDMFVWQQNTALVPI